MDIGAFVGPADVGSAATTPMHMHQLASQRRQGSLHRQQVAPWLDRLLEDASHELSTVAVAAFS